MKSDRDALRAWLTLLTASNALKKSVDTALRGEYGLSISRFDVLSALDRAGPKGLRAGALSQRLMVTEGNTTQVTAPLMRDGLVKRAPSPEDGRVAIFRLTRKGATLFKRMAADHRRWVAGAFSQLSESELALLKKLLGKIQISADRSDEGKDAA